MAFRTEQDAYLTLREVVSERTTKILAWCGAGLSVPAGLPGWFALRTMLIEAATSKAATLSSSDAAAMNDTIKTVGATDNLWVAFRILRKVLGDATYAAVIRRALAPAASCDPPQHYHDLWKLRIAGLFNLNLDRLATRAFNEVNKGVLAEFNSRTVGDHTHVLKSPQPWVYNMHGVADEFGSWVFTNDDLQGLLENDAYTNFVRSALSTSTILFVGITADDVAVGGHLEWLAKTGIDTGSHYWITDRRDAATDKWAEAASIRVIRYDSPGGDHSELAELFADLLTYVPPDDTDLAPPVKPSTALPPAVLDPAAILTKDAETIRMALNRQAMEILVDDKPETIARYDEFSVEYDEAIYRAWYTSAEPGKNTLLGYTLERAAAQGAFGRVYRAQSPSGETVAVKVLLNEVRQQPELLHSFRRGVRSMHILSERGVTGMVPYREASEIPTFVVMDWIDGMNLKEAVAARRLESWDRYLATACQLADIIARAHALPERVLHRDLRPPNIMLQEVWTDDPWPVVVLDFDLSWYRGAIDKSVIHGVGTTGYLAPEQIERTPNVSTRHSAVDSFGIGMTLYFMLSGRDPLPDEHRHKGWSEQVMEMARARECNTWRSLPARIGRLIVCATQDEQSARWDVTQISGELERLTAAFNAADEVEAADLIAEEVAARAKEFTGYAWNNLTNTACVSKATGTLLELHGDETRREISVKVSWAPRKFGKRNEKTAADTIGQMFESRGFRIDHKGWDPNRIDIIASMPIAAVRYKIDAVAQAIDRAVNESRSA
jgi:tRNA A-37 threonylcarbamoyl transferase component Bud32